MAFTGSLQKRPQVSVGGGGDQAVGKALNEIASENATLITGVLGALAAVVAAVKGLMKLYATRKVQIVELLELPAKLKSELNVIINWCNRIEQMAFITRTALDVATWECNAEGFCVDASPALCDLFGLNRDDMLGRGWLAAIIPDAEREAAWNEWARSVANHIPYRDSYRVTNMRTGVTVLCSTTSRSVADSDGKIVGFVGFVRVADDNE